MFLAPSPNHVPPILVHHVERSRSLHETVVLLTVQKASIPLLPAESRYQLAELGDGFYRLIVSFGYMEEPYLLPVLGRGHPRCRTRSSTLRTQPTTSVMKRSWRVMEGSSAASLRRSFRT